MYPQSPLPKTNTGFTGSYAVALLKQLFFALLTICLPLFVNAQQSVTEIITDYTGYWKSGYGHISATKPNSSHNLLAFTYNNVRYSTGVNDAVLVAKNQSFVPGSYKALPVSAITGTVNGNTKIGLGERYDGVHNGASNPAPENNMVKYLTDGVNGLDLGTCVANLPVGNLVFPVSNIQIGSIGDNIPDLVITQAADPSGSSLDSYEFTDINGNRVGNKVDIELSNLLVVGNWTADFYDNDHSPLTLAGGFTNTDRPLRLWTADFSIFGINSSNIGQIAYFKIRLNGNSDVAFVAYNEYAFNVGSSILPVTLNWFRGRAVHQQAELNWQSATETNSDRFIVETSTDGIRFTAIDSIDATGTAPHLYSYTHASPAEGNNWYRLKQVDRDGSFQYSQIISVVINGSRQTVTVYPNPTAQTLFVKQPKARAGVYQVRNMQGAVLLQQAAAAGNAQHSIPVQQLPNGVYWLVWNDGVSQTTAAFVKK